MEQDLQALSQFLKNMAFLRLTDDLAFKAYFAKNEDLLKSLLNHFLPLPVGSSVVNVKLLNPELTPSRISEIPGESGKMFVLDLKTEIIRETDSGVQTEMVNVEMQTTSQTHFIKRLMAYSGRLYSEQIKKGGEYEILAPVYTLVFSTKNLKEFQFIEDRYRHVCSLMTEESPHLVVSRDLCFIIVELGKFTKGAEKLDNGRDGWSYLLKNSDGLGVEECKTFLKKGGDMANALKHLWDISQDEELREIAIERDKQRRDQLSREDYARQEGHEEGMEKGMEKGREEGRKKIALGLLKRKISLEIISETTGLTKKEIEDLKKS